MPLETLDQLNVKGMMLKGPEKKPYVFVPEKEITSEDWDKVFEGISLESDMGSHIEEGAWLSLLLPEKRDQVSAGEWLGAAVDIGIDSVNTPYDVKIAMERFFYARLIAPMKYRIELGVPHMPSISRLLTVIRKNIADNFENGPRLDSMIMEFIAWNARLKILSNGNIPPLEMAEYGKRAIREYVMRRYNIEVKRAKGTVIIGANELSFAEIFFSLKVAYPELCQFPEEMEQLLREWFSEANIDEDRALFLEYALTLYTLSAREIKVVDSLPVFVLPEFALMAEPISPVPTDLKF